MSEFLTNLLVGLVTTLLSILAASAAAWLVANARLAWEKFKAQEPDLAYELEQFATKAVLAAEQSGLGKIGAEKKAYAISVVEKWLALKGFNIDLDLIDAAIEAAVYEELNKDKEPKPAQTGFISAGMGEK